MMNDLRLIHTQGLDEGIRCAMCTNTMKSDKGCDGGCVVDQKMYEKVLKVIDKALEAQPSEDCISREAVIRLVEQYPNIIGNRCSGLIADIKHLPPVTPQYTDEEIDKAQAVEQAYVDKMVELAVEETKRPKGKWIEHQHESGLNWEFSMFECSECHEWADSDYDYCPNCGAEMSGGGEDGAETR